MSSAVCLLSADCLLGQILFRAAGHLENFPSCFYCTVSPSTSYYPYPALRVDKADGARGLGGDLPPRHRAPRRSPLLRRRHRRLLPLQQVRPHSASTFYCA